MDIEVLTKYAFLLERIHWFLVFFAMLSEMSSNLSFPSYNMILGFWGVYSSYVKNGRAVFGLILFITLSIVLDVVFCLLNVAETYSDQLAFVCFVVSTFVKTASLYAASHLFAAIGSARSLNSSSSGISESVYEALASSSETPAGGGGYFHMHNSSSGVSEPAPPASHPYFVNITHKNDINRSNNNSMGHSDGGAEGGRRGGYILQNSDITLRGLGESGAF